MKTSLAKNTIYLSIGNILTKGINLLMIPLFSSWLSTEDYGTFDLYCTYIALLIPIISLSSGEAIFRFAIDETNKDEQSKYISAGLLINLLLLGIIVLAIGYYSIMSEWSMGLPFILFLIVGILNTHLLSVLRAIKKLTLFSITSVVNTIVIAVSVTLFVLVQQLGLKGIIYGYTCGLAAGCLLIILLTKYPSYIRMGLVDRPALAQMLHYSLPLIPNNVSWWVINISDRIIINFFLGTASNGIYALAYKIPSFFAFLFSSFNISWQETAVSAIHSDERESYFNQILNSTISTIISFCCGILALNYFLFEYIFDARYHSGYLYSPILITAILFNSLIQYFGGIQTSLKRTKENGLSTLAGAIINIVLNLVFIKLFDLFAAAISSLIANMSICLIRYYYLTNTFRFRIERQVLLHIVFYLYMLISCYVATCVPWATFNLILTSLFFLYINWEYVMRIISKLSFIKTRTR